MIFENFKWFPITRSQVDMLLEGNIVGKEYFTEFDIESIPFNSNSLNYLKN